MTQVFEFAAAISVDAQVTRSLVPLADGSRSQLGGCLVCDYWPNV